MCDADEFLHLLIKYVPPVMTFWSACFFHGVPRKLLFYLKFSGACFMIMDSLLMSLHCTGCKCMLYQLFKNLNSQHPNKNIKY